MLVDNLSDPSGGAYKNMVTLLRHHGEDVEKGLLRIVPTDVRDFEALRQTLRDADTVLHFAAQVAMKPTLEDPITDFEINARGTLNVLEAARRSESNPVMLYTSTNKVYGRLDRVPLVEKELRWDYSEDSPYYEGITEDYPLDIGGPYGISKCAGDMYFREYAKTYGMKTIVFRMSAVYGENQYTTEVHGWVGWVISRALLKKPLTIFGDGKQVRGVLHVQDLIEAFELAQKNINRVRGEAFNIGGNRRNSLSILELLKLLKERYGVAPSEVRYANWRKVDQKCFIANCRKALEYFGWRQKISKEEGIDRMIAWVRQNIADS